MKRYVTVSIWLLLVPVCLVACSPKTAPYEEHSLQEEVSEQPIEEPEEEPEEAPTEDVTTMIANPWADVPSMEEADAKTGFTLPEVIEDYHATTIRVMNDTLLEVLYVNDIHQEVLIRKQKGEGEDISGDYNVYEEEETRAFDEGKGSLTTKWNENAHLTLISHGGYSYSMYSESGYWGDVWMDFVHTLVPDTIKDIAKEAPEAVTEEGIATSTPAQAAGTSPPDEVTGATPRNPDDEPDRTFEQMQADQAALAAQQAQEND